MNIIKKLREELGYTQLVLAEKTGLSLRTIQRFESGAKQPKGHSLSMLSKVFKVDPAVLQKKIWSVKNNKESDKLSIKLINLSALAFIVCPLGNIMLPLWVWRKRRASKLVDQMGRKIINVQIIWTFLFYVLLCISPFITSSFPLILYVLFSALGINVLIICSTAYLTQRDKYDLLNLPIRLI